MSLPSISVREVCYCLINVKDQWDTIGVHLDVDPSDINAIARELGQNCDRCLTAVIDKWMKNGTATWARLIKALRETNNLGRVNLPREVMESLEVCANDMGQGNLPQELMESREMRAEGNGQGSLPQEVVESREMRAVDNGQGSLPQDVMEPREMRAEDNGQGSLPQDVMEPREMCAEDNGQGSLPQELMEPREMHAEDNGQGNLPHGAEDTLEQQRWEQMKSLEASYNKSKSLMREERNAGLVALRSALHESSSATTNGDLLCNIDDYIPTRNVFKVSLLTDPISTMANSYQVYRASLAEWVNSLVLNKEEIFREVQTLRRQREERQQTSCNADVDITGSAPEDNRGIDECIARKGRIVNLHLQYVNERLTACLDDVDMAADNNSYLKMAVIGVKMFNKSTVVNRYFLSFLFVSIFEELLLWYFFGGDRGHPFFFLLIELLGLVFAVSVLRWSRLSAILRYKIVTISCGIFLGLWLYFVRLKFRYLPKNKELPPVFISAQDLPLPEPYILCIVLGFLLVVALALNWWSWNRYAVLLTTASSFIVYGLFNSYLPTDMEIVFQFLLMGIFGGTFFCIYSMLVLYLSLKIMCCCSCIMVLCSCLHPIVAATYLSYHFSTSTGLLHPYVGGALVGGLAAHFIVEIFLSVNVPGIDDYLINCLQTLEMNIHEFILLKNSIQEALDQVMQAQQQFSI